jgi:hypothetical protein
MSRWSSFICFHPSSASSINRSPLEGGNASFFKYGARFDKHTQACSSVRPWTFSRSASHLSPASTTARSLRWFSVRTFVLRFFFLVHLDELEVTLVLESDEDTESIVRFERVGVEVGIVGCSKTRLAASPTRVLLLRPASLTQSSRGEVFVDGCVVIRRLIRASDAT